MPLNTTSPVPDKLCVPVKRRSVKLLMALILTLALLLKVRPFVTVTVELLATVKSLARVTPSRLPC